MPITIKKNSTVSQSSGGGIGCFTVLFLIFATLKILNVAPVGDWSWWWVTAPVWGPFAVMLGFAAIVFICWAALTIAVKAFEAIFRRR